MKLLTVVGARPQFIKAAALCRALPAASGVTHRLVHTGQHYDENMSGRFFEELEIPRPDYSLDIGSGSHGRQTGRMLEAVEAVLLEEKPDVVLVYGDTNSTTAGALAAAKLGIFVAHVEAGLRSFNRRMPEELNRVVTDHLSSALFCPTRAAVDHLAREGIRGARVHLVGDVMYDIALFYGERAAERSRILDELAISRGKFVLATVHRAENTDDPARLAAILGGLAKIAGEIPVVLPLHPRTRKIALESGLLDATSSPLRVISPVGYLDMLALERNAALIATDSGGVQKEAYFFKVPCVTLRDETEWVELVDAGWNRLVPPSGASAVSGGILSALGTQGVDASLYGEGDASQRILAVLTQDSLTPIQQETSHVDGRVHTN